MDALPIEVRAEGGPALFDVAYPFPPMYISCIFPHRTATRRTALPVISIKR